MITRVRVSGIGPHASTDLTLPASASITGPSESGKSTLIAAIAWCLWGSTLDGALQRKDEAAQVIVSLASGIQIARKRTTAGTVMITICTADGAQVRISSQAGLAPYLGELTDADRGRLVLVPMAWRELAEGPGNGRAFREFLARVLPGSTVTALLAAELVEGEPRDEKRAGEWVRVARQEAAHAQGQADEAARASAGPEPVAPDAAQVEAARAVARAVDASRVAVAAHAPTLAAWRASAAQRAARVAEQARWDAAQPVEPAVSDPSAEEVASAQEAISQWERESETARSALADVAEHERAVAAFARREQERAGWMERRARLVEPTATGCPGVTSGCQRAADAQAAHHAAVVALGDCPSELPEPGACTSRRDAEEAVAAAGRGLASARQRLAALTQAAASWTTYRQRVADRGTRPEDAPDPGPEPIAPELLILSPTERQILADAEAYPRLLAAHRERVAAIAQRAADTAAVASAKGATRTRAEQVLELVRSAPGRVLAGKLAQLGDMGPVTITATDDEIAVLIDGRPWRVASTGRRIAADAILRAALRRAVGLHELPIVVDEAQSVGGIDWPDLGACWRLTTTASGTLTAAAAP